MDRSPESATFTPHGNAAEAALEQELSPSGTPCQGESGGTILLQLLEFKTHLLDAVEELHIRKDAETRFEDQISKLVLEKQELEWEKEALQHQHETAVNQHTESLHNAKRQLQAEIRKSEEEKGKYQVSAELKDKEINTLKEELRSLQLAKYNLEKKSNELEQKLVLQSRSKDSHLNQLGEVEKRFGALSKQCAVVKHAHEKLEQNVDEAMKLNNKLISANKKQEATIISLTKELEDTNKKLIKSQMISVKHHKFHVHTGKDLEIQKLQKKVIMETEMNKRLETDNAAVRVEKQEVMKSLQQMQQLLLSQTQTVSRVEQELQAQREQYQALKQEYEVMRDKSKAVEDKAAQLMESYSASKTSWDKEKKMLLDSKRTEQGELKSVKEAYDKLHQKHTELSSLVKTQAQHITELEVSPPKEPGSILSSLQHTASSETESPDGSEDTETVTQPTEAQKAQNPHPHSTQSLNTLDPFTCSLINTESESGPGVPDDLMPTTSSMSEDYLLISKGPYMSDNSASVPNPDEELIKEPVCLLKEEKNEAELITVMNETKDGGKDKEGHEENDKKEKVENEEQNSVREKVGVQDINGKAGEMEGVPQKRGAADELEDVQESDAEEVRGSDRAEERGQIAAYTAETQILTQTATECSTEKSNTLQVIDLHTEPSLTVSENSECSKSLCQRVCEQDAVSSNVNEIETEQKLLHTCSSNNDVNDDANPVDQTESTSYGEVQFNYDSELRQIQQALDKSTAEFPKAVAGSPSEPSEPLSQARVCSAQANDITQTESIHELDRTTEPLVQSDKPSHITIILKQSDEISHSPVHEEPVSADKSQPFPQDESIAGQQYEQLKPPAADNDNGDQPNVVTLENQDHDTEQKPSGTLASVCIGNTNKTVYAASEDITTGDPGGTPTTTSDIEFKLPVHSTGLRSSFHTMPSQHQFDQGSEQKTSVSVGSLRPPPSRTFMFPRSKQSKVPLVITRMSDLLNASSVSGNAASSMRHQQGEWKAWRAADTENKAALLSTSLPISVSVGGQSWSTTPGCSRAPPSVALPASDSDWETCSQEREEQQDSFRTQISKIEQFLISERLHLSKRRKTDK